MAEVLVQESSLQDIADAIREKAKGTETYLPSAMGDAIRALGGGEVVSATGSTSYSSTSGYTYTVTGIAFTPVFVVIACTARTNAQGVRLAVLAPTLSYQSSSGNPVAASSYAFTEGGFTATLSVNWQYSGATMKWTAYGIA